MALALLLSFFSHENPPWWVIASRVDQSIVHRDRTFFDKNTGALSANYFTRASLKLIYGLLVFIRPLALES